MKIYRISGSAKVVPIYTCFNCGKEALGTPSMTVKFDVITPIEVKDAINKLSLDSHHMPMYWSYHDQFKCEVCKHG